MSLHNARFTTGEMAQTPNHRHSEHLLGFETDIIFFDGLPAQNVSYVPTQTTRKTTPYTNLFIKNHWGEITKKNPQVFDAPKVRFEGSMYNQDENTLFILWSEDRYSTHAAMRDTILPKAYQANLFTINGIPLTSDNKIPIVVRNPKKTDQGRIKHITPAGFVNLKKLGGSQPESVEDTISRKLLDELQLPILYAMENPYKATERELHEELKHATDFSANVFKPERMRILGIVYNYKKNFDYTATVLIPLDATSSEISLKGEEHEDEIDWTSTTLDSLRTTLYELAIAPETNSGHLRGDIALLTGHLYGKKAYLQTLDDIILEFSKMK